MILGKPKYSLKFLTTTNNRKAVRRAPKLSIRNSFLGCLTILLIFFFKVFKSSRLYLFLHICILKRPYLQIAFTMKYSNGDIENSHLFIVSYKVLIEMLIRS